MHYGDKTVKHAKRSMLFLIQILRNQFDDVRTPKVAHGKSMLFCATFKSGTVKVTVYIPLICGKFSMGVHCRRWFCDCEFRGGCKHVWLNMCPDSILRFWRYINWYLLVYLTGAPAEGVPYRPENVGLQLNSFWHVALFAGDTVLPNMLTMPTSVSEFTFTELYFRPVVRHIWNHTY